MLTEDKVRNRFEQIEDFLVCGIDFFGFECAFRGTVVEAVGEGFAVGGDFLAGGIGEEVEAFVGDEERFVGFFEGGFDVGVGDFDGEFHGGVP